MLDKLNKNRFISGLFVFVFILFVFPFSNEREIESLKINPYVVDQNKYPAQMLDGFLSYAPKLAYESQGFKKEYFDKLVKNEEGHFWFVARNKIIIDMLKSVKPFQTFLEIGCGTGYVLRGIANDFQDIKFAGAEIFINGLQNAKKRLEGVTLMQMDATDMPFEEEFDVIGAFDVIEHIKEDEIVLKNIYKSLKKGGHVIITIPQHMWLWSKVDEYACHFRRYTKDELVKKLENAGFKIVRTTSFVTTLLPFMYLSRFFDKDNKDASTEFHINYFMNTFFKNCLLIERFLIHIGIDLPIGGSRIVLAEKI